MTIKRILLLIASLFALSTSGFAETISSEGHVVYKMPDGALVTRNITIEVPMGGEGDFVLVAGDFRVPAEGVKVKTESGRTILALAFRDPPGAPEGTTAVFAGTLIHGTNMVMYYGDMFAKVTGEGQLAQNWDDVTHDATYIGGFHFTKMIEGDEG